MFNFLGCITGALGSIVQRLQLSMEERRLYEAHHLQSLAILSAEEDYYEERHGSSASQQSSTVSSMSVDPDGPISLHHEGERIAETTPNGVGIFSRGSTNKLGTPYFENLEKRIEEDDFFKKEEFTID